MAMKPLLEFSILEISSINGGRSVINETEHPKETRKNRAKTETDIHSLPSPVLADILSRVPVKTVFGCMTVSKPWLSVIDNSFFISQHFSKAHICPLLIFDTVYPEKKLDPITMHLVEGESVSDLDPQVGNHKLNSSIEICRGVKSPRTRINGSFLKLNSKATSCEGVICSAPRHGGGRDHVIIFNPITGEYVTVNLFKCNRHDQDYVSVFIGLGFSRVDKKFKLLRVSRRKIIDSSVALAWWPEFCIVGTKGWERVQVPSMPPINFMRKVEDVIYASGMIYWSYHGDDSICSFDFDANEFQVLPLPEMDGVAIEVNAFVAKNMHMGVLGGSLCVSLVCPSDGHIELWTIDKNGENIDWRKILDIETKATAMEHNGSLWTRGNYKAIKYLECGKVLLHDWRATFLVYDPVTKSDKLFCVLDHSYLNRLGTCLDFQVVPHLPSLVSLSDTLSIEDASFLVIERNSTRERGAGPRRSARIGRGRGRGGQT